MCDPSIAPSFRTSGSARRTSADGQRRRRGQTPARSGPAAAARRPPPSAPPPLPGPARTDITVPFSTWTAIDPRDAGCRIACQPGLTVRRIAGLYPGEAKTGIRDAHIIGDADRSEVGRRARGPVCDFPAVTGLYSPQPGVRRAGGRVSDWAGSGLVGGCCASLWEGLPGPEPVAPSVLPRATAGCANLGDREELCPLRRPERSAGHGGVPSGRDLGHLRLWFHILASSRASPAVAARPPNAWADADGVVDAPCHGCPAVAVPAVAAGGTVGVGRAARR